MVEGRGDDGGDKLSDDAVVGVVDSDGAGAVDASRVGFWDDKEATMIEVAGGGATFCQEYDDGEKDGGRMLSKGSPGGEGDSVRAGRGVIGA